MKKILFSILAILIIIAAYVKYAISKFDYDFSIVSFRPVTINLREGAVVNIVLNLIIKSSFFFSIPVKSLYYEIYFKGNIIGRSPGKSDFVIRKKGEDTVFNQSIDAVINKNNIEVLENYINKVPTNYTAKIMANVFGININLKNIKFTY